MQLGLWRERAPDERRVALVPADVPRLTKAGARVAVERGAGDAAGFRDEAYAEAGATLLATADEVLAAADVVLRVRCLGAEPDGAAGLGRFRKGQVLVGFCDPLNAPRELEAAARAGVTVLSMELVPRITRAQSMDALSSMATITGYRAALLAAMTLPRLFPMMMTAAGTIAPARVFVIGAGVAGLQAIATCRRLGASLHAYDLRPAVREEVESLGARFVEIAVPVQDAADAQGYAKAQDEDFYRRQREMLARVVSESDVVITTAAVPGRTAPVLVTEEAVRAMPKGGVVVDLAAERGGNCALTRPGETVEAHGVTIIGPLNLPSAVPGHASQLYSRNVANLVLHLAREGRLALDRSDAITGGVLAVHDGEVRHPRLRELLSLPALESA